MAPWQTASAPTCARDLDLALGDQRPGDRGAEQILALVERVGAEHREDVVADELLAQIVDEDVLGLDAEQLGLAPRRLDLLALAEIGGEGDDLAPIFGLQPFEDDRGVEPARISEHDLLGLVSHQFRVMRRSFSWPIMRWKRATMAANVDAVADRDEHRVVARDGAGDFGQLGMVDRRGDEMGRARRRA